MYSCKLWAKFSSISKRKQIPYYSRNIPVDINRRADDPWVCGIPVSKTWAALHAIVFHHWLSASVWGVCRWHNSILPERWREWVIVLCVWVCVWQTERLRTNECTALCCRSTVFFLHLCRTLTASGSALLPTSSTVTSVTHKRPLPSQPVRVCVCVSQSNYRRIPGQWASLCMRSHAVSPRYRSFDLFVAYPSLIITAFRKSYSSYGNCIRPAER